MPSSSSASESESPATSWLAFSSASSWSVSSRSSRSLTCARARARPRQPLPLICLAPAAAEPGLYTNRGNGCTRACHAAPRNSALAIKPADGQPAAPPHLRGRRRHCQARTAAATCARHKLPVGKPSDRRLPGTHAHAFIQTTMYCQHQEDLNELPAASSFPSGPSWTARMQQRARAAPGGAHRARGLLDDQPPLALVDGRLAGGARLRQHLHALGLLQRLRARPRPRVTV